jgi:uncharacterized caspase-like protein
MNEGHFAVVVGINRYPGLPTSLNHARDDAEDFHQWLVDPNGGAVPEENVKLLVFDDETEQTFVDYRSSHPTIDEINNELREVNIAVEELVERKPNLWDETRLYLYASGHGITPGGGIGALLSPTSVYDARQPKYDNLEFQEYWLWYFRCGLFHEVVVFADCCREHQVLAPTGRPPFPEAMRSRTPVYWTLGFAAEIGEYAQEEAEPENGSGLESDDMRGYFTKALMNGLRGGAAHPETGAIGSDELGNYVSASLKCMLEGQAFAQSSSMDGSKGENDVVLRPPGLSALARFERKVTLAVESDAPSRLRLYDDHGQPTAHEFMRDAGTVSLDLPEGRYQVRDADGRELETLAKKGRFLLYGVDRSVTF